jgi:hypothetical protein
MSTAAAPKSTKTGYDVPRPAGQCAACGASIEPGEKFFAAVRETPTGLERLDVSTQCWANFDHSNLLGFWQTTMPAKGEQPRKLFVDDEALATLFERLADAQEPIKIQFRFVLGLILMRKRVVLFEESRRDGDRSIWIVRLRGKQDRLELLDPKLTEEQVAEVSQQLNQILSEEL